MFRRERSASLPGAVVLSPDCHHLVGQAGVTYELKRGGSWAPAVEAYYPPSCAQHDVRSCENHLDVDKTLAMLLNLA